MSEPAEAGDARFVAVEHRGPVAWVMMDRPRYANTQNFRLLDQLDDAFKAAVDDPAIRVIVLGGNGKHFSSGHDMGTPDADGMNSRERRTLWYDHVGGEGVERQYALEQDAFLGLCRRWQEMPKPVIAMVQGACIAGGLMLAWIADLIVASDDAFFQDPVVRMGIPGVEYFAHAFELPTRIAREFLLLGEKMSAERAYQYGMVNRVVPRDRLAATVEAMAIELADRPHFGVTLTKRAFNAVDDLRGKRNAMEAVFHMHHLAHAHQTLTTGSAVGGVGAKAIAASNRKDD